MLSNESSMLYQWLIYGMDELLLIVSYVDVFLTDWN